MINTSRIVPVDAVDLISLYGLILLQNSNNSGLAAVQAVDPGVFEVSSAATPLIAAEPVKTLDFAAAVTSATVYFVAAYDFFGFTANGVAVTTSGSVEKDGRTLYKATLADGSVTIAKVGF